MMIRHVKNRREYRVALGFYFVILTRLEIASRDEALAAATKDCSWIDEELARTSFRQPGWSLSYG